MPDQLHRFTFERFGVRGEIVMLAASWRAVVQRHDYSQAVLDYLGQALAATVLLSGTIKLRGSLILQIQGKGPIDTLVAQATDQRMLRGMVHASGDVPKEDFRGAFADGHLVLTAEAPNGERYQGIVEVDGDDLAATIENYFRQSEQLPTRVWLAADANAAGGLFLQRLPGETVEREDWERVCLLAATITSQELLTLAPGQILRRLFHEEDVRIFEPEPVAFRCSCSRRRIEDALRQLGREEIDAIIREQGAVEVDCEFCNAHYYFDTVDAAALFTDAPRALTPDSRH